MEEWRDVVGYEGFYQVSSLGNVRSIDRFYLSKRGKKVPVKGVDLKQHVNRDGYMELCIQRNSRNRIVRVHRLVAEAFIPNLDGKPEVNHINGVKTDNRVCNLEWCTGEENTAHAVRTGLVKYEGKQVLMDGEAVFDSITKCAKHVGVDKHEIRRALNGEYKTVHGHTFCYVA